MTTFQAGDALLETYSSRSRRAWRSMSLVADPEGALTDALEHILSRAT